MTAILNPISSLNSDFLQHPDTRKMVIQVSTQVSHDALYDKISLDKASEILVKQLLASPFIVRNLKALGMNKMCAFVNISRTDTGDLEYKTAIAVGDVDLEPEWTANATWLSEYHDTLGSEAQDVLRLSQMNELVESFCAPIEVSQ